VPRLLHQTQAGILLNGHLARDRPTVFARACRLGAKGIMSKKINAVSIRPVPVWIKVRNPASIAVQRERSEIWNRMSYRQRAQR
jgi:hypothetical protein